jgi:hypothetical protein
MFGEQSSELTEGRRHQVGSSLQTGRLKKIKTYTFYAEKSPLIVLFLIARDSIFQFQKVSVYFYYNMYWDFLEPSSIFDA